MFKTKRVSTGEYEVFDTANKDRKVTVMKVNFGGGGKWQAISQFNKDASDPTEKKMWAVKSAIMMLKASD